MKKLLCICYIICFYSCSHSKYVDIVVTSEKRGWCFIIFSTDSVKYKFANGKDYKIHLDSNNVAYLPKTILGKGYNNRIFNKQGIDIKEKMRLFGETGFDEKTDMLEFYYRSEKELQLPDITWIEPNDYVDVELSRKQEEICNNLKKLGY